MLQQSPQTPLTEAFQEGLLMGEAAGSDGGQQSLLSEISEADIEALRQKEEALLQIEVSQLTAANSVSIINGLSAHHHYHYFTRRLWLSRWVVQ